jgi:hypothetical protein
MKTNCPSISSCEKVLANKRLPCASVGAGGCPRHSGKQLVSVCGSIGRQGGRRRGPRSPNSPCTVYLMRIAVSRVAPMLAGALLLVSCGDGDPSLPTASSPATIPGPRSITVTAFSFTPREGRFRQQVTAVWTLGSVLSGFAATDPLNVVYCLSGSSTATAVVDAVCMGDRLTAADWTSPISFTLRGGSSSPFRHADIWISDGSSQGSFVPRTYYYYRQVEISIVTTASHIDPASRWDSATILERRFRPRS